jgi:hypothetical protein
MTILDAPMGALAQNLIATFGRPATLRRPGTGGEYDATTGQIEGAQGPTDVPCQVVFEEFGEHQIDGTLIQAGDRKAIVSRVTLGTEPVPQSDTLVEGDNTWQILRVEGFSSGAFEAAYAMHVRR